MPSTKTRKDWAYSLFLLSREITGENQTLLANELNVHLGRYVSTPFIVDDLARNIDYGFAKSRFEPKGAAFGLKTKHSNSLLSDVMAQILIGDFKVTSTQLSDDEVWDLVTILLVTFSAFERLQHEINSGKRIYAKDMLSFRLYTYQLTIDSSNQALLRGELFDSINDLLVSWERFIGLRLELRDTISYGSATDSGESSQQSFGFYLKDESRCLDQLFPSITDELKVLPVPEFTDISQDEWQTIVDFFPYYLQTFMRYPNEVDQAT